MRWTLATRPKRVTPRSRLLVVEPSGHLFDKFVAHWLARRLAGIFGSARAGFPIGGCYARQCSVNIVRICSTTNLVGRSDFAGSGDIGTIDLHVP